MSESNYSLLLLDPKKSKKEDDNEYDEELYKKNVKFKMNNFEKFKPKKKVSEEESEKALKGAENQVKSILSGFLRNFNSEEINNSDIVFQQINVFKNTNDLEQISNRKRSIKKIRTTAFKKFLSKNSNKYDSTLIGNKNEENDHSPMDNTINDKLSYQKLKKYFSISSAHKKKKNEYQKNKNIVQFKLDEKNININKDQAQQVPELNLENIKYSIINQRKIQVGKI